MVFQSFNLFPHLNVLENLMLCPVRLRGMSRAEAGDLADACSGARALPTKNTPSQTSFPADRSSARPSSGRWP